MNTAIDEILHGRGDVAAELRSWSPGDPSGRPAQVVLDLRLFGLTATACARIHPITPENFFGDKLSQRSIDQIEADLGWKNATTARLLLDKLIQDKAVAVALLVSESVSSLLSDLQLDRTLETCILQRLGLGEDTFQLLEPLVHQLPQRAEDVDCEPSGAWRGRVGIYLARSIEFSCRGSLREFVDFVIDRNLLQRPYSFPVEVKPSPRPSRELVCAAHAALEEILRGNGDVAAHLRSWSPGGSEKPAELVVDLRMLGLAATLRARISPITPQGNRVSRTSAEEIAGPLEYPDGTTARLVLDRLINDERLCVHIIASISLRKLLDKLGRGSAVVTKIFKRLGIEEEFEALLDPLAQQLPQQAKEHWYCAMADDIWWKAVGNVILGAVDIESAGPLQEFVDSADQTIRDQLPGRYKVPAWLRAARSFEPP